MVKLHKTGADVGLYVEADCGLHVALFCMRRRRICQYTVFFSWTSSYLGFIVIGLGLD